MLKESQHHLPGCYCACMRKGKAIGLSVCLSVVVVTMKIAMRTTGLVEIVNITGLSLYRRLQMLGKCGVYICALESSSFYQVSGKSKVVSSLIMLAL